MSDAFSRYLKNNPPPAPPKPKQPVVIPYLSHGAGVWVNPNTGMPTGPATAPQTPGVHYVPPGGIPETPAGGGDGGGGGGGAPPKPEPFYDPTIDWLTGQKSQDMTRRQGSATEQQKRILLGFGSRELAKKLFGENDPFTNSVSDDPSVSTSWLAEANRRLKLTLRNTSEMLGHQYGLWNSSGRNEALGDIGREHQTAVAEKTSMVGDELAQIQQQLAAAEADWANRLFEARRAAWQAGATNHGF